MLRKLEVDRSKGYEEKEDEVSMSKLHSSATCTVSPEPGRTWIKVDQPLSEGPRSARSRLASDADMSTTQSELGTK